MATGYSNTLCDVIDQYGNIIIVEVHYDDDDDPTLMLVSHRRGRHVLLCSDFRFSSRRLRYEIFDDTKGRVSDSRTFSFILFSRFV